MIPVIEHDPEKWKPVFGKDHAPIKHLSKRAFCAGRHRSVNLAPRLAQSGQALAFSRRIRARVLPTPLSKSSEPDRVMPQTGGGTGFRLDHAPYDQEAQRIRDRSLRFNAAPGFRFASSGLRIKIKGSGTPTDAHCMTTASADAAAPRSASRARLSAFHHGTCGSDRTPPLSSSSRASWDGTTEGRCYPPPAVPVQRAL